MSEKKKQIGVTLNEEDYEIVRLLAFESKKSLAGYVKSLLQKEIEKQKKKEKKR